MQSSLDILDVWLVAAAFRFLLVEKILPDERLNFKGLPRLKRNWENWESHFQDAQEALERVIRPSNPSADSFGSANTAAHIHGIAQSGDAVQIATNRGAYRFLHQGLSLQTTSLRPSADSWTTWLLQRPKTSLFFDSFSPPPQHSTRQSRHSCSNN